MESAPDPANVRILTTLGHVDHGKTTLMDALLAANNIISPRMAGKMRYLDSREDEQERGITMESSAVSLKFQVMQKDEDGERKSARTYIINMIDTPGHVDFSSEVSTASRLCDGALVLVDVVEGVCTQTIAVLRRAWQDNLKPILVINKFDRLITELKLAPIEAYHHLSRLIEQVNAVMGGFFASDRMEDDYRWNEDRERRLAAKKAAYADEAEAAASSGLADSEQDELEEKDDEDIYFAPERGNVVFASALDGWGFRVSKFAQLYAAKLGIREANLRRVLWGDFFLDPKQKKVLSYKHLKGRPLKPLAVQFVLENIWAVYDGVVLKPDSDKVSKIVTALNLKIPPRDLRSKDTRYLLSLVFSQWLPLSTCIIQTAIDIVPPPAIAQATRIPRMLYPDRRTPNLTPKTKLERDLFSAQTGEHAYVVAYVSKMFAVQEKDLPENRKRPLNAEEMRTRAREAREARTAAAHGEGDLRAENIAHLSLTDRSIETSALEPSNANEEGAAQEKPEIVLGFARLYSGTLHVGTSLSCLLPKYDALLSPDHPSNASQIIFATVEGLYVMMGRELLAVPSVEAGNIFAVRGLSGKVYRCATLCALSGKSGQTQPPNTDCLINLGGVAHAAPPIVRVALEPLKPADLPQLLRGLKLLSQSDPCVETFQQHTGEHVILTAGELHLERCLKDLRERFAKVEVQASKPIVPFRETAVKAPDMATPKTANTSRGTIAGASSNGFVTFTIRACPLPEPILQFILDNGITLRKLLSRQQKKADIAGEQGKGGADIHGDILRKPSVAPDQFWQELAVICDAVGEDWKGATEKIWAFGPQGAGGCMLIDSRKSTTPLSLKRKLQRVATHPENKPERLAFDFDSHVETGFQLATLQGPLCAEPVQGLAYFVEALDFDVEAIEREQQQNRMTQITGFIVSGVREACRNGLLDWSPRLMLAMYTCDIQASTDVLGKVYGVVAKRRGRIVAEEMKEGTSFFNVSALLPVVESFGFADDIRKRTSGAASPQLIFSGYELLDQDPFWVPTTEEELEDLGDKADRSNVAKAYMDAVRERKGMFVDKKIVEFAEKQRTLKH